MQNHVFKQRLVITTTEVRRNLNSVIQEIRKKREHAVIEKSGSPIAVLLPIAEYEELLRYRRLAMFDKLTREIGEEFELQNVTEQELYSDLKETKRQVVKEQYARIS